MPGQSNFVYNDQFLSIGLLYGFPELIGLPDFGFSFDIANVHISARQHMTQFFPPQMLHQMVIVKDSVIKAISFRCHQKSGGFSISSEEITISFFESKQTVKSRPELSAHRPIVQRTGQYDHIAFFDSGINLSHIILLDTGTFFAAVAAKTAFTSVNVHSVQKKFGHHRPVSRLSPGTSVTSGWYWNSGYTPWRRTSTGRQTSSSAGHP